MGWAPRSSSRRRCRSSPTRSRAATCGRPSECGPACRASASRSARSSAGSWSSTSTGASVFLVNVPICAVALVLGFFFIPTSRDPDNRPLDPLGALLSILTLVVAALRDHPGPDAVALAEVVVSFAIGLCLLGVFVVVGDPHRRSDDRRARVPQRGFSAASAALTLTSFALVRLAVPAHAVLPVRARLLAVRGRAARPAGRGRHDGHVTQRAEAWCSGGARSGSS